jgi:hypothetical protein
MSRLELIADVFTDVGCGSRSGIRPAEVGGDSIRCALGSREKNLRPATLIHPPKGSLRRDPLAYSPSIAHANRPPVTTLKPTSSRLAAG